MSLTLPCVVQSCDRLCHDDAPTNTTSSAIVYTKRCEYLIQCHLHEVPIAHDAGASLKYFFNLAPRCSICIGIVSDVGNISIELAVTEAGNIRRERDQGALGGGEASTDVRGACDPVSPLKAGVGRL